MQSRNCNQRETPISSAGDAVSASPLPHPLPLNSATPAKAQGLFESQLENQVPQIAHSYQKNDGSPGDQASSLPQENQLVSCAPRPAL